MDEVAVTRLPLLGMQTQAESPRVLGVWGSSLLGFRVQGLGFRVLGLGFWAQGLRVQGLGFGVKGSGLRGFWVLLRALGGIRAN